MTLFHAFAFMSMKPKMSTGVGRKKSAKKLQHNSGIPIPESNAAR